MFWIMARFYHRILKGAWRIWIRLANMPRPLACLSRRPRPGLLARPPVRPGAPAWRALRPEPPPPGAIRQPSQEVPGKHDGEAGGL